MKLETLKRAQTSLFEVAEKFEENGHSQRNLLYKKYSDKLILNPHLNRATVSFQENKSEPFYRWLKFKEGFSSKLVKYFLNHFNPQGKCLKILDPFAGSGTTLTTSINDGHQATGIELLPVGTAAMRARLLADAVDLEEFQFHFEHLKITVLDELANKNYSFPHLRITKGAFSPKAELEIAGYLAFVDAIKDENIRYMFWFACLSILEDISYTSKDGQYLRWDFRSGRVLKSRYEKRVILTFRQALLTKLLLMFNDLAKRNSSFAQSANIIEGSCLNELIHFPENSFDLVITSPPYCNRYDYTRTYALELAFLGYDEDKIKELRQALLSSTVENKGKKDQLYMQYCNVKRENDYKNMSASFSKQEALQEILWILNQAKKQGKLNNNNVPNMVENYFFEMNIVIHELARILVPGGRIYIVNDNVQYFGQEIPVDLILSDFAQNAGMQTDYIWILPRGKGNSSQQMGQFGRNEIRKCVYVWTKQ